MFKSKMLKLSKNNIFNIHLLCFLAGCLGLINVTFVVSYVVSFVVSFVVSLEVTLEVALVVGNACVSASSVTVAFNPMNDGSYVEEKEYHRVTGIIA